MLNQLLNDDETKWYIALNEHEGIKYFNKERFENLINWLFTLTSLTSYERKTKVSIDEQIKELQKNYKFFKKIKKASTDSGYKFNYLLSLFEKEKVKPKGRIKKGTIKKNTKRKKA